MTEKEAFGAVEFIGRESLDSRSEASLGDEEEAGENQFDTQVAFQGPSIEDLTRRCEFLLNELKSFADSIRQLGRDHTVELRGPCGAIEAELKSLKKLSQTKDNDDIRERIHHVLRSSNVPYHETVWAIAKRSKGVIAFNKRFFWHSPQRALTKQDLKSKYKRSALVDIVCDDGAEWIKVSTITETRVLFELARQGWESADETSGSEEDKSSRSSISNNNNNRDGDSNDSEDDDTVSILRMAQDLSKASQTVRVRYKTPRIRFILPKIRQDHLKEIDKLLYQIRALDISVETDLEVDVHSPDIYVALPDMLVDEFAMFSDTLNVDCTILLALVSDLSHAHVEKKPWFPQATARQIEMEQKETLLPSSLYPAMGSHTLVCTKEAVARMKEIVGTIGTSSEKARTALLMGDDDSLTQKDLVGELQKLSDHEVPTTWQLPVRIVDKGGHGPEEDRQPTKPLPAVADKVAERLSDINQSVFLYGWRTGRTTITSNRTVARQIEETIEANRHVDAEHKNAIGPPLWLCPMARSLVGKEKSREKGGQKTPHA